MQKYFTALALGAMACCLLAGCAETKTADIAGTEEHDHDHGGHNHGDHDHGDHDHDGHDHADHDDHDHDGDHDHGDEADVHGPNGGHVFKFDSDDYQAEWKHYNDNDVIRVYVLDAEGEEVAAVKADVSIVPLVGAEKEPFELEAEEADADGKSAVYSLDEKALAIAMALGVNVEMKIGDKTYTAKIDAHEPHDH